MQDLGRDMAGQVRVIMADHLTRGISALDGLDKRRDVVLMVEVEEEGRYVPHHPQKIVFLLSAMRHFAEALRADGIRVDYVALDDPGNTHSFTSELVRAVARHRLGGVVLTEPGEYRVAQMVQGWEAVLGVPVAVRADTRFFCSRVEFARLNTARKATRMEFFYREMRRRTGILMDQGAPVGGQWNLDGDNRKPLPRGVRPPDRARFAPDAITRAVMALVQARFASHFGEVEPFGWAVTRGDALVALDHFITDCLPQFGDYQDAMTAGSDFLFHGLISPYLNCGLLTAAEVCGRAEAAWRSGAVPLNAAEGFVRQILGWREFVRGIYWAEMPGYAQTNHLNAVRPLPAFYWTGATPMRCMAQVIGATRRNAYAHHIQRLMITGNFALLAGVAPAEIEEWYLAVYIDAFDWVELPNTHGMVMYADGGRMGSKPYAASGAYINRMSDYCGGCAFDPRQKTGPEACPFNYLYWNFLIGAEPVLARNPRMALPYRTLSKMTADQRGRIAGDAEAFLQGLGGPRQGSLDDRW